MRALEIIDALDAGRPQSERLNRLRARVDALDGVCANVLSELCDLDGGELVRLLHRLPGEPPGLPDTPRGLDWLVGFVEGLADERIRCRVVPHEAPDHFPAATARHKERRREEVRKEHALGDGEWTPEAERSLRMKVRQEKARRDAERFLVLEQVPAGGQVSGPVQVLAALAVNRQLRGMLDERSRDLQARRERVLEARA